MALADPGEAVKKAAVDAAVTGVKGAVTGLGKGLFSVGNMAFQQLTKKAAELTEKDNNDNSNNKKNNKQKIPSQQQVNEAATLPSSPIGESIHNNNQQPEQATAETNQSDTHNKVIRMNVGSDIVSSSTAEAAPSGMVGGNVTAAAVAVAN